MTPLNKSVRRRVVIAGRDYNVSLIPADEEYRFDRIQFVQKRKRTGYWMPLESCLNESARRWLEMAKKEKRKARAMRKKGGVQ